ncbi:MAG: ATP synthase F1 subunit epsilon [Dehalococcoidia bacterium]|nr:ATP synthase F1 subunit epsilon [Dehalococcoidia bacterium]|tara:strand:+ start:7353 stop:7610 length:258 start_codon:yes stop_codon:yes gene_type:complete
MAIMKVQIITPEEEVYSGEVDVLVAPGTEGQLGILPNHSPLMTALQQGTIRVTKNGSDQSWNVTGGFLEVLSNQVMILAEEITVD